MVDSGIKWRALPADFPPWSTVYKHFAAWERQGATQDVLDALRDRARPRSPHRSWLAPDDARNPDMTSPPRTCAHCRCKPDGLACAASHGVTARKRPVKIAPAQCARGSSPTRSCLGRRGRCWCGERSPVEGSTTKKINYRRPRWAAYRSVDGRT
ncbi:transposase [Saccharomonospora saliphila]|uniref:transposase n=1 Tax=Saccharomonospora saliphila TaxID=369829 RepID=UPI0038CD5AA7